MVDKSEFQILQGSDLVENKGMENEGRVVICNRCSRKQNLKKSNAAGYYFDCWVCHSCNNYLLLEYRGELRQPFNCLHLTGFLSNLDILKTGDFEYNVVKDTSDELTDTHLAAYLLNREARQRDIAFGTYQLGCHYPHVVLDDREAVAYLLWGPSSNDNIVLRQLFVREPYRRQGIGSSLVEYWWKDTAKEWCENKENVDYYIEAPNDKMRELIISISHNGEDGRPEALKFHYGL